MALASNCVLELFFNNKLNSNSNSVYFEQNWKNDSLEDYWVDLEKWLIDHSLNYLKLDIVYVKPEEEIQLKIKLDQNEINKRDCVWNYACITWPNDETYFYYVDNINWLNRKTAAINLSLDTLSTYWPEITANLTDKTTVFREHKDRFIKQDKIAVGTKLLRKIDPKSEGIDTSVKQIKSIDTIHTNTTGADYKWYLIYKTNNNNTVKPIETYLCASKELTINDYDQTIVAADLDQTTVIYINYGNITLTTLGSTHEINITDKPGALVYNQNSESWWFYYHDSAGARATVTEVISISFLNNTLAYYLVDINHYTEIYTESDTNYPDINFAKFIEYDDKVLKHNLGGVVKSIDLVNRTYSNLNAIIECPYCPTNNLIVDSNDNITYINKDYLEFVRGQDLIRVKDSNNEFYNEIVRELGVSNMIYEISDLEQVDDYLADNPDLESKLYHSDYNNLLIQYDNWNIPIKREMITATEEEPKIKITYKQSNQLSSNCLFKVDSENCEIKETAINELTMLPQRNNELTIYQSDYLNYMRTGYNYDKKQNAIQLQSAVANAVANTITTIASLGVAGMSFSGAVAGLKSSATQDIAAIDNKYNQLDWEKISAPVAISALNQQSKDIAEIKSNYKNQIMQQLGTGSQLAIQNSSNIISSWYNVAITKASQDLSIERKKAEYLSQSASTSGSNDLDLFKFYNGDNKLKLINLDILDDTKLAIEQLFYYLGYTDNTQHIPDTNSRAIFNFIQINPDFENCRIFDNYKQNIITRLNTGVTIWHQDKEFGKNNIEIWLKENQ